MLSLADSRRLLRSLQPDDAGIAHNPLYPGIYLGIYLGIADGVPGGTEKRRLCF